LTETDQRGQILYRVVFEAAPGERNDVIVQPTQFGRYLLRGVLIRDSSAGIVAAAPCQAVDEHTATCAAPPRQSLSDTRYYLGDLDDALLTVTAPEGPPREGEGIPPGMLTADGGPGNDRLTVHNQRPTLVGGEGNDELRVLPPASGRLEGGPGDDELWADETYSELIGGGGRDVMHGGNWVLDGDQEGAAGDAGPGPDVFDLTRSLWPVVSYESRHAPILVDLRRGVGGQAGEGDIFIGVRMVEGGHGDDRLLGDRNPNRLLGGPGFDRLEGRGGNDRFAPGDGGSRLNCGTGMDVMFGRATPQDWLAIDCEYVSATHGDGVLAAHPFPVATGSLRYAVHCPEPQEELTDRGCSARLRLRQAGGRHRLVATGAIPLGGWHKRTMALTLTAAGQRRAARRRFATVRLELHRSVNGSVSTTYRWTTRIAFRR
jgi:hypothetical protein